MLSGWFTSRSGSGDSGVNGDKQSEEEHDEGDCDATDDSHGCLARSESSFWATSNGSTDDFSTRSDPCLEGNLLMRKGRATGRGSFLWKKRYVHLSFADGGSISVYDETPESIKHQFNQTRLQNIQSEGSSQGSRSPFQHKSLYSRFHNRVSAVLHDPLALEETTHLMVFIPNNLPWTAKDVEHTDSTFAIEIPTDENGTLQGLHLKDIGSVDPSSNPMDDSFDNLSVAASLAEDELYDEMAAARGKGKPVRIYFKCRKGSSEKALWLEAFSCIDRLSLSTRHTHGFISAISNGVRWRPNHRFRKRTVSNEQFALDNQRLEEDLDNLSISSDKSGASARIRHLHFGRPMKRGTEQNEYRVLPGYAYPHRWMTLSEMHSEMMLPSTTFHDLRDPNQSSEEIGQIRVEVLQCVGLPRLDRNSDTDAVVYMVCGPYAFATDVIRDHTNPMWLRKSKRACIFPIFHGYARLYVGVFDDDGEKAKDDFVGRIVIDVARLRHSSTYDVTMPLRLSTHAYSRRKRGSVRLRFTLYWKSEKDVFFSYIPRKIKFTLPQHSKPNVSTTIACADPKAFRNIALTVHGVHMSGRFTFPKIKATIREINFTRKFVMDTIRQEIQDTRKWVNPTMSGFVFCSWMHCIYENKFSFVPGYFVLYIVLQLIRTYAIFLVEGPFSEGFLPPTWEEMFHALITPQTTTSIEPLHLHRTDATGPGCDSSAEFVHMKTHEPKGRFLFRCLGFLPWNEPLCMKERDLHLEFPFADGKTYPRFTVRDAMADPQPEVDNAMHGVKHYDDDSTQFSDPSSSFLTMDTNSSSTISPVSRRGVFSPKRRAAAAAAAAAAAFQRHGDSESSGDSDDEDDTDQDVDQETEQSIVGDDQPPIHNDQVRLRASLRKLANGAEALNPMNLIRDQDLDWEGGGGGEKLTDSLERIKYKMHSIMWHAFNDYVYNIKNPESVYFYEAKNLEKVKKRNSGKTKVLDKKLDKLLGVKQYSHNNPLVSRLGLYVEPMIDAVLGYLCLFRAFFNLVTWQDPYLTFLLSVFLLVLAVVLFIIPWRPTLFAVGMLFVGPQNWVIRKLRERGTLPPIKPKERAEEVVEERQMQIFHSHKRTEGILAPKPPPDVHPLEIQHIVVPYGHLMYQRFYDWPPEQQYATVIPTENPDNLLETEVSELSLGSARGGRHDKKPHGTRYPRLHKLRRRIKTMKRGKHVAMHEMSQLLEVPFELAEEEEDESSSGRFRPFSNGTKME
ncbi:hypothetical protein ACA910_018733 [Epithemia clementina (nom. ined.)]